MKSIKETLIKTDGVREVEAYREKEKVVVTCTGIRRGLLMDKLSTPGYPEKGNNSLLYKAKSLMSCATGKMV